MPKPGLDGTNKDGIQSPMNSGNIPGSDKPATKTYPDLQPSGSGGGDIKGPGEKNAWPR